MYRLDEQSFRALSSKTRVSLLKALQSRNYTVTELAAHLGKTAPTIKEHINSLSRAGLIRKIDSGHKWKYYALTRKGKSIFDAENTFTLDLIILIVGALGVASSFWYSLVRVESPPVMERSAMAMHDTVAESVTVSVTSAEPSVTLLLLGFLFALVAIISVVRLLRR